MKGEMMEEVMDGDGAGDGEERGREDGGERDVLEEGKEGFQMGAAEEGFVEGLEDGEGEAEDGSGAFDEVEVQDAIHRVPAGEMGEEAHEPGGGEHQQVHSMEAQVIPQQGVMPLHQPFQHLPILHHPLHRCGVIPSTPLPIQHPIQHPETPHLHSFTVHCSFTVPYIIPFIIIMITVTITITVTVMITYDEEEGSKEGHALAVSDGGVPHSVCMEHPIQPPLPLPPGLSEHPVGGE